jgi:hypothetical protein
VALDLAAHAGDVALHRRTLRALRRRDVRERLLLCRRDLGLQLGLHRANFGRLLQVRLA